jgi:hypothetical protein
MSALVKLPDQSAEPGVGETEEVLTDLQVQYRYSAGAVQCRYSAGAVQCSAVQD